MPLQSFSKCCNMLISAYLMYVRFLYALIIYMDTNFCLKNQIVSSFSRDPGLGIGWVYFIPKAAYDAYVLDHMSDKDVGLFVFS